MNSPSGLKLSSSLLALPVIWPWFGLLYVYHGGVPDHRGTQTVRCWEPELDQFMSDRGFALEEAFDRGGSSCYYEVRKNGMTIWRLDVKISAIWPRVDYLGPVGHEEAYLRDYSAALQESQDEYTGHFSTQTANLHDGNY